FIRNIAADGHAANSVSDHTCGATVEVDGRDASARRRQLSGDRPPDAAGGTGDPGCLAGKREVRIHQMLLTHWKTVVNLGPPDAYQHLRLRRREVIGHLEAESARVAI